MGRRPKTMDEDKPYNAGDQIHITVTQDFAGMATEFFRFCKRHHYSPSDVIRGGMVTWLEKTKKMVDQFENSDLNKEFIIDEILKDYPWLKGSLTITKKGPKKGHNKETKMETKKGAMMESKMESKKETKKGAMMETKKKSGK